MVGGEAKPATAHLRVIIEVGTAAPPFTMLDVVGEKTAHP
jgi:hypothetical protein